MTPVTLASVFLLSLAGSVHCAAMCGGFVAAYAGGDDPGPLRRAASHVAYNGGRLVTYLALGAAAGAVGRSLDLAGAALGLSRVATVVTGVVLLLAALSSLRPASGLLRLGTGPTRGWAARVAPIFQRAQAQPAARRAFMLGLATTLLPCGWLYAFVALAAGTSGALSGAALMGAFWLGSLPILLGLGVSLHGVARRFARHLPRLRTLLLIGAGVVTLVSRVDTPALAASEGAAGMAADCPHHPRPEPPR
jgi:sulfite exporter TauE/SafE